MSDSEEGAGVSKPLIEEIEDDKNYSVEQFELGENGEERVEKEENVPLADLVPETTETSDFLEGGPQKRQVKLTEKGKAYEIEKPKTSKHLRGLIKVDQENSSIIE